MNEVVTLSKKKVRSKGTAYAYWILRWYGADGKRHTKTIGRTDELSKRQAEKSRQQKIVEFQGRPGRRNANRACSLGGYLDSYFEIRKREVLPKAVFFGEN